MIRSITNATTHHSDRHTSYTQKPQELFKSCQSKQWCTWYHCSWVIYITKFITLPYLDSQTMRLNEGVMMHTCTHNILMNRLECAELIRFNTITYIIPEWHMSSTMYMRHNQTFQSTWIILKVTQTYTHTRVGYGWNRLQSEKHE